MRLLLAPLAGASIVLFSTVCGAQQSSGSTVVVIVQGPAPNEEILIDGHRFPPEKWAIETPLDPGEHRLEANAPGRKATALTFTTERLATREVIVPPLIVDASAPGVSEPQVEGSSPGELHAVTLDPTEPGLSFNVRRGQISDGRRTAGVYERLCDGPCTIRLPAGSYHLAVAKGNGGPVSAGTISVDGPTTVRGSYASNEGTRAFGLASLFGGPVVFGGLGLGILLADKGERCSTTGPGETVCRSDNFGEMAFATGAVLAVASAITGLVLLFKEDTAHVSATPTTTSGAVRARDR